MRGRDDEIRALTEELRALMERARPIVEELTSAHSYAEGQAVLATQDGTATEEEPDVP